jgi:hypothetical protein
VDVVQQTSAAACRGTFCHEHACGFSTLAPPRAEDYRGE